MFEEGGKLDKIAIFCEEVKTTNSFHENLYKEGKCIPRPLFFRRILETENYPNENFREFIEMRIGDDSEKYKTVRDIISGDKWLHWTSFTHDYVETIYNEGLFLSIGKLSRRNNEDEKTLKLQSAEELEIIENLKSHRPADIDTIDVLSSVGNKQMKEYLIKHVYDKNTIKAFQSILDYILDSEDEELSRIKINTFLGQIKRIGSDSAYGMALKATLGNFNERRSQNFSSVIVKAPISTSNSHELIHEAVIGNFLNNERDKCVNFSAVYDVYIGGVPILDENGVAILNSAPGEMKVAHAIYEVVNEAVPISAISDHRELALAVLHCALGLRYMHKKLDFTHYDCHDDNVLMYKYNDSSFYIPHYFTEGEKFYVKCFGRFPMFIDYGMSHIQFKEEGKIKNFGILDSSGYATSKGIYNDMSNPLADIFKLIFMLIRTYRINIREGFNSEKNNYRQCKHICQRMAGFFFDLDEITDNDFSKIHERMWENRYHVRPEIFNNRELSLKKFIKHCMIIVEELVPDSILYEEPELVLGKILPSFNSRDEERGRERIRERESIRESIEERIEERERIEELEELKIKEEETELQIERQMGEMGIKEIELITAFELYTNKEDSGPIHEKKFLHFLEKAESKDRERALNFEYNPGRHIHIIQSNSVLNRENILLFEQSLLEFAKFISIYNSLNSEKNIVEFAISKIEKHEGHNAEGYRNLLKEIIKRLRDLNEYKNKLNKILEKSKHNLNEIIFKKDSPTEDEIAQFTNGGNKDHKEEYIVKFYQEFIKIYELFKHMPN